MKPNILFIFDDQHRHSAMGCYGNRTVRTPAFDRFAGQGMVFDQAFSSCPICSPFRGQVLTGNYSHTNGVACNEYELFSNQVTLARALEPAGYRSAYIGKWHLGYPPYTEQKRHGFDLLAAYNCRHDYDGFVYHENEGERVRVEGWGPTGETDRALRFIEEHVENHPDAPFLCMLGWGPPHWSGPDYDDYPVRFKHYDPSEVDLPPNVPRAMAEFARGEIAHYYGMVEGLDHEFGRLMDALDRLGLAENTIVVFTSDHGDHLSAHGYGKPFDRWLHPTRQGSKATPFDESIHIPLLVRGPGVGSGRTDVLFSSVDFMPTILSLCGIEDRPPMQGTDLSAIVGGGDEEGPDSVYLQIIGQGWPDRHRWIGHWRALRTRDWVYARWIDDADGPFLFDRRNDPYEMKNLYGDPAHRHVRDELEGKLRRWMKNTDDPFETGERHAVTGELMLGQRLTSHRFDDVWFRRGGYASDAGG